MNVAEIRLPSTPSSRSQFASRSYEVACTRCADYFVIDGTLLLELASLAVTDITCARCQDALREAAFGDSRFREEVERSDEFGRRWEREVGALERRIIMAPTDPGVYLFGYEQDLLEGRHFFVYIGQSLSIQKRLFQHFWSIARYLVGFSPAYKAAPTQLRLQNDALTQVVGAFGADFVVEVLELLPGASTGALLAAEKYWQAIYSARTDVIPLWSD